MSKCICTFPPTCGGTKMLDCDGCGGDLCVCASCYGSGEMECPGCEECDFDEDDCPYNEGNDYVP